MKLCRRCKEATCEECGREITAGDQLLWRIFDKSDMKDLTRNLNKAQTDLVLDIIEAFHKELDLDRDTEAALNRFGNLLSRGGNQNKDALMNQLRKVADLLGLGYY